MLLEILNRQMSLSEGKIDFNSRVVTKRKIFKLRLNLGNMVEIKFDVVKPNLYVVGNSVYFGVGDSEVIPACRTVDEVVGRHIGELKVRESDLRVVETHDCQDTSEVVSVPLSRYLDACEESGKTRMTNADAKLFGLGYLVAASVFDDHLKIGKWFTHQIFLEHPNEGFDRWEECVSPIRADRDRTLDEMKRQYDEITAVLPEYDANLTVIPGVVPLSREAFVGRVSFGQLIGKDAAKIDEAKSELVEKLKAIDGPCLSFDAPRLLDQAVNLFIDAPYLVRKYGDILCSRDWDKGLFRLDP